MKILLKNILIQDKYSSFNQQKVDLLISNGIIEKIEDNINSDADIVFNQPNTIVSQGWVDIFSHFSDPGFEQNETIGSGSKAAASGGFTRVFCLPNTNPEISNKAQVNYIEDKAKEQNIFIHPIGAVSKKIEGKEIAEMYEMFDAGAIAFSDGLKPIQSSAMLLKALQYVKSFNGTIIQLPIDDSFSKYGFMNEGAISTQIGIPGTPTFAENLMIKRDIELLKYTNSKLHISGVSTAEGIFEIKKAKQEGFNISCSVTPHHLLFCDEDLHDYNTNYKVNPVLRTKKEMNLLRECVVNGEVDCIASHHIPIHSDFKECEFDKAHYGMIHLQTLFSSLNSAMPSLSTGLLVDMLSNNQRELFNIPTAKIELGNVAELTMFNREEIFCLNKENNKSKSLNSALFNLELKGKVFGTVNKGKLILNN